MISHTRSCVCSYNSNKWSCHVLIIHTHDIPCHVSVIFTPKHLELNLSAQSHTQMQTQKWCVAHHMQRGWAIVVGVRDSPCPWLLTANAL